MNYFVIFTQNCTKNGDIQLYQYYDNESDALDNLINIATSIVRTDGGERQVQLALQHKLTPKQVCIDDSFKEGLYIWDKGHYIEIYEKTIVMESEDSFIIENDLTNNLDIEYNKPVYILDKTVEEIGYANLNIHPFGFYIFKTNNGYSLFNKVDNSGYLLTSYKMEHLANIVSEEIINLNNFDKSSGLYFYEDNTKLKIKDITIKKNIIPRECFIKLKYHIGFTSLFLDVVNKQNSPKVKNNVPKITYDERNYTFLDELSLKLQELNSKKTNNKLTPKEETLIDHIIMDFELIPKYEPDNLNDSLDTSESDCSTEYEESIDNDTLYLVAEEIDSTESDIRKELDDLLEELNKEVFLRKKNVNNIHYYDSGKYIDIDGNRICYSDGDGNLVDSDGNQLDYI